MTCDMLTRLLRLKTAIPVYVGRIKQNKKIKSCLLLLFYITIIMGLEPVAE